MQFDPISYAMGKAAGGGGSAPVIQSLSATANGTYTAPSGVDGYSPVTVNVSGGSINWRDSFSCNWDFSNPVNTRGQTTYESPGTILTIDGWRVTSGILQIVSGGVKVSQYTTGTTGYFFQRYSKSITGAFYNKTMICSAIIDGELGSFQVETTSGSGHKGGTTINGMIVRIYNYSTGTGEFAVTFDIESNAEEHLIQAVKLEAGSVQTLATNRGGIWVLNNTMDAETERIKAASGWVYNS